MKRSIYIVVIEHEGELPETVPMTDVLAEKAQNHIFAKGKKADVRVTFVKDLWPLQAWEMNDAS